VRASPGGRRVSYHDPKATSGGRPRGKPWNAFSRPALWVILGGKDKGLEYTAACSNRLRRKAHAAPAGSARRPPKISAYQLTGPLSRSCFSGKTSMLPIAHSLRRIARTRRQRCCLRPSCFLPPFDQFQSNESPGPVPSKQIVMFQFEAKELNMRQRLENHLSHSSFTVPWRWYIAGVRFWLQRLRPSCPDGPEPFLSAWFLCATPGPHGP